MDLNSIIVYVACIIFLFLIGSFFIIPLKTLGKIIGNSILGGILIFLVNLIGGIFGFHIGLNVGTALITGILGIPRCYLINTFEDIYRLGLKNKKKDNIIRKTLKGDLIMKYNRIEQESRLYEYGEGKEFKTREEALKKAQKEEKNAKTKSALLKLWDYVSKTEIVEKDNAFQVVAIFEIPSIFE